MKSLTNNTLEDIAKYSNKTFKLVNYLSKSGQPIMLSELTKVHQMSDNISLLESFNKDINSTVSMYEKAYILLSVVDDNDKVYQLKGPTDDLKEAFGENYDAVNKTLNIGGVLLNLRQSFNKNKIKEEIVQNILGISQVDFKEIFKKRKEIYQYNEEALADNEERIAFLSVVKDRDNYKKIIDKIKDLHNGYMILRASMDEKEKRKIDQEITFTRSMVDSVTQQSTFIKKGDGFLQISATHKAKKQLLKIMELMVNKSRYIKAIELDKDTSLENTLNVLKQMDDLKLNLDNEIVFKVRKLGNYNANGLYLDSQKIVAVDISEPSSVIYELCQAMDMGDKNLLTSDKRREFLNRFKFKINKSMLPGKASHYLSNSNVMARLGEIAYVFQKYRINEEQETIKSFIQRVKQKELNMNTSSNGLSMTKTMEYFKDANHNNIYFDLEHWDKEDIKLCKHYFAHFFNVDNENLHEIKEIPIFYESNSSSKINNSLDKNNSNNLTSDSRKKSSRYQKRPVSFMNENNMEYLLDYNKEHHVISFENLFDYICQNLPHLSRTRKTYTNKVYREQIETMKALGKWLSFDGLNNNNNNSNNNSSKLTELNDTSDSNKSLTSQSKIAYTFFKNYVKMTASALDDKHYYYIQALKDGHQDKFKATQWLKEEDAKLKVLNERAKKLETDKNEAYKKETSPEFLTLTKEEQDKIREPLTNFYADYRKIQDEKYKVIDNSFRKTIDTLRELYPEFKKDKIKRSENIKLDDGTSAILHSGAVERLFHHPMNSVVNFIKKYGWEELYKTTNDTAYKKQESAEILERSLPMLSSTMGHLSVLFQSNDYKNYNNDLPQLKKVIGQKQSFNKCNNEQLFESKLDIVTRRRSHYGYERTPLNNSVYIYNYVSCILPEYKEKFAINKDSLKTEELLSDINKKINITVENVEDNKEDFSYTKTKTFKL